MVDRVCDAKGGFFLIAINGGTRSIDEMVHRMMTASFQDCKKAHDIGINVSPEGDQCCSGRRPEPQGSRQFWGTAS